MEYLMLGGEIPHSAESNGISRGRTWLI